MQSAAALKRAFPVFARGATRLVIFLYVCDIVLLFVTLLFTINLDGSSFSGKKELCWIIWVCN